MKSDHGRVADRRPGALAEKLRLVDALAATGVSRIEATSFVSPRAVPALADAELLAAELHQWPGIEFSALVAGIGGAKRAVAAGMKTVEYVVSASNGHSEANTRSTTEQATERIGEVVRIVTTAEDGWRSSWPQPGTVRSTVQPTRIVSCGCGAGQGSSVLISSRSQIPSALPRRDVSDD